MKILLLLSLFGLSSLFGANAQFIEQMHYESDYQTALQKALKENKSIMMVLSTKTCPWCRKMENQTLKKDEINNSIKEHFIPLALDNDDPNSFPKQFETKVVPTIYFVDPKQEEVFARSLGYKNKKDFGKILNEAIEMGTE